ncbi:zinc finger protein 568-like [Drosophila pseudoobscura]|uniref:Zinc finger protein 568-like n=1 Tax=Drosophila pseudoobscura pseudoobscura TaxID=46245 RepID=A0A6I8V3C5_DROPS|nr:zinc finger protein 568 [Drosophila pseudoobscura]XP_033232926.1 zinc finger protein 568 [Drosophila pseudoobscura]
MDSSFLPEFTKTSATDGESVPSVPGFITEYHLKRHTTSHKTNQTAEMSKIKPLGSKNTYRRPSQQNKTLEDHNNDRPESICPRKIRSTAELLCPQCYKCFDSQYKLEFHINKTCHKCPQCSRFYVNERSLRRHQQKHMPLAALECTRSFPNMNEAMKHGVKHSGVGLFKCQECNAEFIDILYLQIHSKEHFNEHGKSSLLRHTKDEIPIAPLEYTRCPHSFPNMDEVMKHRVKHSDVGMFKCQECNAEFIEILYLQIHSKEHAGEKGQLERSQGGTPPSATKQIDSDSEEIDCEMLSCSDSPPLVKMMKLTDPEPAISNPTKKDCTTESLPKKRNITCQECGMKFTYKNMTRHMRVHTGERPFECTYCEKKYTRKIHLDEHNRIHTGERPYGCLTCGKKFIRKYSLVKHIRAHTGEGLFDCSQCDKKYRDNYALKHHFRNIHSGERLYEKHKQGCSKKKEKRL